MIYLWRLGNLEYKVLPTEESIAKFVKLLKDARADKEGDIDIVWGPAVDVQVIGEKNEINVQIK